MEKDNIFLLNTNISSAYFSTLYMVFKENENTYLCYKVIIDVGDIGFYVVNNEILIVRKTDIVVLNNIETFDDYYNKIFMSIKIVKGFEGYTSMRRKRIIQKYALFCGIFDIKREIRYKIIR